MENFLISRKPFSFSRRTVLHGVSFINKCLEMLFLMDFYNSGEWINCYLISVLFPYA